MGNKLQKDASFKHAGAQPKPVNMSKSPFITKPNFGYQEDDYAQKKLNTPDKVHGHFMKLRIDDQTRAMLHRKNIRK